MLPKRWNFEDDQFYNNMRAKCKRGKSCVISHEYMYIVKHETTNYMQQGIWSIRLEGCPFNYIKMSIGVSCMANGYINTFKRCL